MATEAGTNFKLLAENSADIICRAGLDYSLKYVSPSCFRILGWTPEEMISAPPFSLMVPEDAPLVQEAITRNEASGTPFGFVTLRMRKKDGSIVWMEVTSRQVLDPETGEVAEFVTVMRDISERKKFEEKLEAQARTDALTGLANRRSFDETLRREWKRTAREGGALSLLLVDIDHFKAVNDTYGHPVGDEYLRIIGEALRKDVRLPDTVARYGGEELAVILPVANSEGAVKTAERLRTVIAALALRNEGNIEGGGMVTVSIGTATAMAGQDRTIEMPESLLLAADMALYQAKQAGRNRVATGAIVDRKDR